MKITSTSWHFRFNSKIQNDRFTDKARCGRFTTCSYIRTSIYSVVQALWFTFLACFTAIVIGCAIGCAIWVPFSIFFLSGTPPGEALTAASVVWGLIAFGLLVMTWKYVEPRFVAPAIKEPNVFIQAIKDHHGKFCTRVEVV
jgi:hypothetical protein